MKYGWYDKLLGLGIKSGRVGGYCTQMALKVTADEMNTLISVLDKITSLDVMQQEIILEGVNWAKQETKLILRSNEFGGLTLLRVVGVYNDSDDVQPIVFEDDPDPVSADSMIISNTIRWEDEYEKFYISRKDDLKEIMQNIRSLYVKVEGVSLLLSVPAKIISVKEIMKIKKVERK